MTKIKLDTTLLVTLVICLWGIAPILSKRIYKSGINPITNMLCNTTIYLLVILLVAVYNRKIVTEDLKKIDRNVIMMQIVFTVVFMFGANYTNNYLIKNNNPSYITSMTSVSPVITMIASYYLLNEEITQNKVIGVLLIISGIYFLKKSRKN